MFDHIALLAQLADVVELLDTFMVRFPWMFVAWMVVIGGTIGSFLNVVVFRLPAGMSIVHPPSRCPKCETPIRSFDNIPVLGWILLGGKCRNCRLPISVRYPIVEAIVAALFGALAFAIAYGTHDERNVLSEFAKFVYFANGCTCLLAFALIDYDGHLFPRRLTVYTILTGVAPPAVAQLAWSNASGLLVAKDNTYSLVHLAASVVLAGILASFLSRTTNRRGNFILTSMIAGILVGPVSLAMVLAASIVNYIAARFSHDAENSRARRIVMPVPVLVALTISVVFVHVYRGSALF
ncbi:MAG: prepilin peptidase [Planctomycetales bacterium]|nr:prepilin peptidase [Planctomycetales bacterium]